ncbi:MAG: hypothetical protein WDO56_21380 [Gammaproteobacteria bacterium]
MDQALSTGRHVAEILALYRGSVLCLAVLGLFFLLPPRQRAYLEALPRLPIVGALVTLSMLLIGTAVLYLAFPGYFDHLEPTTATLGQVFARGSTLYPYPDFYPYYGVLYGPGLAISQSMFSGLGLPVLVASKLPGVLALLCSIPIMWRLSGHVLARGYFLLLIPFGYFLFWVKAEPFLVLLVCLALLIADRRKSGYLLAIAIGLLAGVASALKIHGAIYVGAAYLAATILVPAAVSELLVIVAAAIFGFMCFFASESVSLSSFLDYLRLAGRHGLSAKLWLQNFVYLVLMLAPLALVVRRGPQRALFNLKLAGIAACELLVTVVAAKQGAGTYHLIPLIPVNACLLQQACTLGEVREDFRVRLMYTVITIPALASIFFMLATMGMYWGQLRAAGQELQQLQAGNPSGLTMGVSNDDDYGLSYLRVMLPAEQVDYGAYMDLELSGIAPDALEEKMRSCAIGMWVVPGKSLPFSLNSYYTHRPLFPDRLRQQFNTSYEKIEEGRYFAVYACRPGAARISLPVARRAGDGTTAPSLRSWSASE